MSALSAIVASMGGEVSGSDCAFGNNYERVQAYADIYIGSNLEYIERADIVVVNLAIPDCDIEYAYARELNKHIITRQELLAEISYLFKNVIAISGTHGKSTVTSMLTEIFYYSVIPFSAHIGAIDRLIDSNYILLGDECFITEACEYKSSFLTLTPSTAIITNIDYDHPDCFKSEDEFILAFNKFMSNSDNLILNENISIVKLNDRKQGVTTVGYDDNANYTARNIMLINNCYSYDLYYNKEFIDTITINSGLLHNVLNSMYAIAAAREYDINYDVIKYALYNYQGIKRRYEQIAYLKGANIILDYAHHPTEIENTINSSHHDKEHRSKLLVVFEPHTFSRTKALFNKFTTCFQGADCLIMLPTYAAREQENQGITALELFNKINNVKEKLYITDYKIAYEHILNTIEENDTILIVGAGNIEKLAEMFKNTII